MKSAITAAIQAFSSQPLREASTAFLATLGYQSDKTIQLADSSPQSFLDLIHQSNPDCGFSEEKALVADWKSADLPSIINKKEQYNHAHKQ